MKNRIFRIAICFILIVSMVLCEATIGYAVNETSTQSEKKTVKEVSLKEYSLKDGNKYIYTGSQIKPHPTKVVVVVTYEDANGKVETSSKTINEFGKVSYKNNTAIGTGYVVVKVEGKTVELPFEITLGRVSSLKAKAVSHSVMGLSWNKVAGAAGYEIYRSNEANGSFKKVKTITSGKTITYKNTGLSIGEIYFYKVRAYRNVDGAKAYGEYSSVVKRKARPAATTITRVKRATYKSLKISWKPIEGASGYRLYISNSPNGPYKRVVNIRNGNETSYTDGIGTCGKTYYYKVRAYRKVGLKKYFSLASEYKKGRTTPAKTNFLGETMAWYKSVDLEWKSSKGATGYEIYRSTKAKSGYTRIKVISNSKTTKWTNSKLKSGKTYYYRIRPFVKVGKTKVYGAYSNIYTKYAVPKKLESLVKKYEDVPYRLGGNTPKGWDCSGFVQWATYYLYGKKIGRTASDQARGGKAINRNNMSSWKPGDVLVYKRNGGGVSHVGMYIGGGKMMHALNYRYGTVIHGVDYYEKWDGGNYLAAVRRY